MTTTERLKTPLLFPCAARVKMPQLGSEDSDLKLGHKTSRIAPETIVFRNPSELSDPISREYLKKVSLDLAFEEEVVKERCYHALPYDEKYLAEAFDISDLVPYPPKTKIPVGRHNARGTDVRHMPCNLTKSTKPHLKPLKRKIMERAQLMHLEALKRQEYKEIQRQIMEKQRALEQDEEGIEQHLEEEETEREGVFITEAKVERRPVSPIIPTKETTAVSDTEEPTTTVKPAPKIVSTVTVEPEDQEKRGNDWDAYVMSLISTNTANWIVYEKTPQGTRDREKLENLLKKWYGTPEHTDLVRDEMSDSEDQDDMEKKTPKKKWIKKESTLLQKVYNLEKDEPKASDPYSDDNTAPFYRQPAGLRRAKKHTVKEELGAINKTAASVQVKTYKPPPPTTLRDFINPEVGDYVLDTNNMFQQEQLTGTEQIYDEFGDKTKIIMESNNKYKKDLQPGYPQPPENWFPATDAEKQEQLRQKKTQKKKERGHRRWKKLPQPIDDTAELLSIMAPGVDSEFQKSADPRTRKTAKNNQSLMQITSDAKSLDFNDRRRTVKKYDPRELLQQMQEKKRADLKYNPLFIIDEWRTKWHLSGQFVDSTPDDLIKDMADIQPHVRLKAIATCAKATDYKPPEDHGIQLDYLEKGDEKQDLPEKLFVALECLLDDPVDKVKTAAAITLYSLNRPCDKAQEILYTALQSENPVDRWAAAQCLAHFGVCDSDIVGEILCQVMTTEDTIKHERGISMLGVLSITSNLVHSLVAEQLNSSSWRHKVIACKILPTLKGDINKDITNKLSDLMWNDWHTEVRRAAAQCLGKTGHGRDVHDDLRQRILDGDERIKLEALSKVGQLGIMTAKLLPAFLKCFEDEYVAIRSEVCITCGNIAIKDEEVIAKLIQLATFDTIWKIKALAFQALGKIGVVTEQIVDCLLWAVRYEENPGVRAEACHTLKVLKVKTEEVADVLQDRFLVESNPLVRDELASTLRMFDISATEDMDMVAQIKKEVKKLCTRNIIATQITLNELDQDKLDNLARMIYESEKDLKEHEEPKEPMMERVRSFSRSSSLKSKPESGTTTPEPAHRDTVFTPTADQELEAILGKEEVESGKTSPTETETPATKSRATSASTKSRATSASTRGDQEEEEGEMPDDDKRGKSSEEERLPSSLRSRSSGVRSEEGDVTKETGDIERPTSTVKFAAHLEVADIPARSRSSLGPSRMSLMDEHGKPSRSSMMTGTTGTEGMVFGRDAVVEREKINEEARNTFAVMDLRYRDMVEDLIDLDNTFELGLLSGSRQDFENKIQNMRIIKTPPSSSGQKAKVELAIKKGDHDEKEKVKEDSTQGKSKEKLKEDGTNEESKELVEESTADLKEKVEDESEMKQAADGLEGKVEESHNVDAQLNDIKVEEADSKSGEVEEPNLEPTADENKTEIEIVVTDVEDKKGEEH